MPGIPMTRPYPAARLLGMPRNMATARWVVAARELHKSKAVGPAVGKRQIHDAMSMFSGHVGRSGTQSQVQPARVTKSINTEGPIM